MSHLFYDCRLVLKLWEDVRDWFLHLTPSINIPIEKINILFGVQEESIDSVANFVILCGKYYVWKTKQTSGNLSMISFKMFLKSKLDETKNALILEDKTREFDKWLIIVNLL